MPHLATKASVEAIAAAMPHLATAEALADVRAQVGEVAAQIPGLASKASVEAIAAVIPHLASKADLSATETRMIRWFIGTALTLTTAVFTLAKLVH
jgi:hypothetical protein